MMEPYDSNYTGTQLFIIVVAIADLLSFTRRIADCTECPKHAGEDFLNFLVSQISDFLQMDLWLYSNELVSSPGRDILVTLSDAAKSD